MSIRNFQVQYILRSYSRQLANRVMVSKRYIDGEEVIISSESKKRLLVENIVQEIMSQFTSGTQLNETAREILERLSKEYGQPLEVSNTEEQAIIFRVLDKENGKVKCLSASENERLQMRLIEIVRSTVYENLTVTSTHINIPVQK